MGVLNGFIILFSILGHELMHSITALKYGINVPEIELYIFGGVSKIEEEPSTPRSEALIAGVGPLSSLIIGFGFLIAYLFSPASIPSVLSATFLYSGISNIGLGFFNLIPAFPMDGGRVLRAFIWSVKKDIIPATRIASKIGRIFGYGFMIFGVFQILLLGMINGFWLILVGSYLNNSARRSYVETLNDLKLSKIHVKEMISTAKLTIPFDMIISDAIREYFIPYNKSYFSVSRGEEIVGIIHINDIKKLSLEDRAFNMVGYIMRRISEFPIINEEMTGKDVVKAMRTMDHDPQLVVVREKEDNELLGFVGQDELVSSLRFWQLNEQTA